MNEQMRDALRQAKDTVAAILEARSAGRVWVYGRRLPNEVFELAHVTHVLLAVVGQQQEVMAAQQKEIAKLKERLGS